MGGSPLGQSVIRLEDPALLLGEATYVDNLPIEGVLHASFVRSPYAMARVRHVDVTAATAMPGVVAVHTAATLGVVAHGGFVSLGPVFDRPPLATDLVRFVGEPVALVVATSKAAAVDAAEAVEVDYQSLAAVVDMEAALAPGAPVVFADLGSNLCMGLGDPLEPDPLEGAEVVVRARFTNQRVAAVPMEANAIAVVPEGDRLVVHAATQMPHELKGSLARVLGLAPEQVRVVAPNVGGGFGAKIGLASEFTAVAAAARALGRPVKWMATRSEDLVSLPHGRAQVQYVELGLRRDGTIVGMRVQVVGDSGAYPGIGAVLPLAATKLLAQGTYRIPRLQFDVAVAITNTTPVGAFRGAGRPEATALLERIVDMAAAELGLDPAELRRRNFLQPEEFPLTTITGANYDTGDYERALDEALRLSGYDELRAEQARRRASGERLQLGIGLGSYVEVTAGGMTAEFGAVEIHEDGSATVKVGTSAHGQGHATTFAQIVSDRLGIPYEQVRHIQSDTDLVRSGMGTGGSRSLQVGGTAVYRAADAVLDKARHLAAHLLEAEVDDITLVDGRVGVAGVPARALSWAELAQAAGDADRCPPGTVDHQDGTSGLAAQLDIDQGDATYPFGTHVAVVEVDVETGQVRLVRHVAVDDCGRIVNPMIVAGQVHGGIAQGAAQVLFEAVAYDDDGNPLTSTLADYLVPSAAELPSFETGHTETPTHMNPLGAKGIGEAGTIGALPAVHNAVVDALAHLGVHHVDLPCTPERVWRAIEAARAGERPDAWRDPPAAFADLPRSAPAGEMFDISV